jgi:uncharacterized protein (TIRG00374 family)
MKKFFAIGLLISIITILFLVNMLDFSKLIDAFAKISLLKLLPCVIIYLIVHILRVTRWMLMLRPVVHTSFKSPLSALSICLLANNILPGHMGELVRAYLVAAENKASKSAVLATVVVERVYDGLSVLFFLLILLLWLELPEAAAAGDLAFSKETLRRVGYLGLAFFGGLLLALRVLCSQEPRAMKALDWLSRPFPEKLRTKIAQFCANFVSGLRISSFKDLSATILLSLSLWFLQCLWAYSPAPAFGLDIPVSAGFLMTVALTFAMLIPSAPAFVGTFQMAAVLSLSCFGIDPNEAGAYSIVLWAVYFVTSSLLGLLFAWRAGLSWRALRRGELV